MKKLLFGKPKGQMMVLYVCGIAALLGAVALGTDVSVMYMNWQHSQKVADASALAGANFLTGITFPGTIDSTCTSQKDDASQVACTYAVKNGLTASDLNISDTATTITVTANQTNLPYFFAKALGMTTYAVGATAVSRTRPDRSIPLTRGCCRLDYSAQVLAPLGVW